ncbi:GNAT family N-acetyltransferase [Microbacterium sp. LjRoot45]|uniref:GNAT family N-acetyltransferase n=1 Tax=Microbacterium sp. LjRoot45 TaxID=3342329 RepID=UPI003ECC97AE
MTRISALTAADRAHWQPMWDAYLAFYREDLPAVVTESTFARLTDAEGDIHGAVAWDDAGGAVGFVHWLEHPSTWSTPGYCYLEDLFVAPDGRRGGVGKALIDHVVAWAAERGREKVYWLTAEDNATARSLYDRVAHRTGFVHYEVATASE